MREIASVCRVVFIPNYNVKLAEIVIPGSDVSQVLHFLYIHVYR